MVFWSLRGVHGSIVFGIFMLHIVTANRIVLLGNCLPVLLANRYLVSVTRPSMIFVVKYSGIGNNMPAGIYSEALLLYLWHWVILPTLRSQLCRTNI